ncbi:hypothetical protein F5H01DRAFT_336264 [Linnemannia elongata]|nr:hypothetical protein F5H01DRAFT_336264 [Linnemannia elongata]
MIECQRRAYFSSPLGHHFFFFSCCCCYYYDCCCCCLCIVVVVVEAHSSSLLLVLLFFLSIPIPYLLPSFSSLPSVLSPPCVSASFPFAVFF